MWFKYLRFGVLLAFFLIVNVNLLSAKTIYYVTQNGTGDGSSWAKAAGNIQTMIDKAASGDEVWVAKGKYKPMLTLTSSGNSKTFNLKDGVSLYGGYSGSEKTIAERVLADIDNNGKVDQFEFLNTTILDGDDDIPDVWTKTYSKFKNDWSWTVTGNRLNCNSVVSAFQLNSNSSNFDGFTVINGNCQYTTKGGGGIYSESSNVQIRNCVVRNCSALLGGGIYSFPSNLGVSNCKVYNCNAVGNGGGIFGVSNNCTIYDCTASGGGGVYGSAKNSIIFNCTATIAGGGVLGTAINSYLDNCHAVDKGTYVEENGGGISGDAIDCTVSNCTSEFGGGICALSNIIRCKIYNCIADKGGAIFEKINSPNYTITNCLIYNCTAYYGAGIHCTASKSPNIINCTIANCDNHGIYVVGTTSVYNHCTITNCAIVNRGISTDNRTKTYNNYMTSNPIEAFISPTSFVGIAQTTNQKDEIFKANWHLRNGSPCINKGANITDLIDIEGNTRVQENIVDIGAYEFNTQNCVTRYFTEEIELCKGNSYNEWCTSGKYSRSLKTIWGCDSIVTTNLTVNDLIKPTILIHGDTLISSSSYASYQWFNKNGKILGANLNRYIISMSGSFSLQVTNTKGCSTVSEQVNMIKTSTGRELDLGKLKFYIFPNPNCGIFDLKIENYQSENFSVQIFNDHGLMLYEKYFDIGGIINLTHFDISHLPRGIYLLKIFNKNLDETKKIVIQ